MGKFISRIDLKLHKKNTGESPMAAEKNIFKQSPGQITVRILLSLPLLAAIILILFTMEPSVLHRSSDYRQGVNYPPDGTEQVALIGFILMTAYVIMVNYFFVEKLRGFSRIAANLLLVVLFFGVVEGAVARYTDSHDRVGFRPDPLLIWVRNTQVNSMGFVYPEFPAEKEPNEFRFILAGDSTAEGFDINRFSDVMERNLQKAYPDKKIRVINAACAGYSIVQVKNLLKQKLYKLKPDCVIISLNNDPLDDYMQDKYRVPSPVILPILNVLYKSRLYLLLRKRSLNRQYSLYEHNPEFHKTNFTQRVVPEDVDKFYKEVIDGVRSHNSQIIIMAMPSNYKEGDYDHKYKKQLGKIAGMEKVPFVDLYSEWKTFDSEHLFMDRVHTTTEGHIKIGEKMCEFIIKEKIIK